MDPGDIPPKLSRIGFRSWLMYVHKDLLKIDSEVEKTFYEYPDTVTNLERFVLILEDRRFFGHIGVDVVSVARELIKAAMFRSHGGASTIDMQFVRTVTGYKRKTITRKFYEIFLSVIIQRRYGKAAILRSYLRIAFFGSHLVGSRRASKSLFGVGPNDLDAFQAALLASMLVYPKPLAGGDVWLSRVRRRAEYAMRVYPRYKKRVDKFPS